MCSIAFTVKNLGGGCFGVLVLGGMSGHVGNLVIGNICGNGGHVPVF